MNRFSTSFSSRFIAAAVVAVAAWGAASAAHARPEVQVSIGLPGLPVLIPPLPPGVRIRTEPVYGPPPVVVDHRGPSYRHDDRWDRHSHGYRHDWERRERERREWERREWERREWERHHHGRDRHHDHRGR